MTDQTRAHAQDERAKDRMAIAEIIGGKIFNDIPGVIPGAATRYAREDALKKADAILALRSPAAVEPAQCEAGSRLSPRQQASKMLFGDIHWVDREDMSDLMDDEFVYDDGSHKRNISPNALITELEAAQQGIDAIIAKLDACLVPDNVLDEVRSALTAARTPAASEGPTLEDLHYKAEQENQRLREIVNTQADMLRDLRNEVNQALSQVEDARAALKTAEVRLESALACDDFVSGHNALPVLEIIRAALTSTVGEPK